MKSFHAVPESHAGADEKREIKFQWPCFSLAGSCPDYPLNILYLLKSEIYRGSRNDWRDFVVGGSDKKQTNEGSANVLLTENLSSILFDDRT